MAKRRTSRKKLIDKLDETARALCKERTNWKCEWCGRDCWDSRRSLHWSHIFSRRHHSTRWSRINCAAHCASCHRRWHESPIEGWEWFRDHCRMHYQGELTVEVLKEKKNTPAKFKEFELEEMLDHLKGELMVMRELRLSGDIGRIEWEDWQ